MEGGRKPSLLTQLWANFYASPFWWAAFAVQLLLLVLVNIITGIIALITTLFGSLMRMITSYRFLIFFAVLFVAFFFMHKYWSPFVHGVKKYVFPFIDITYNDLLRFIWNELFLPVVNILIYVWDAFVQLIGFVIYIVLNLVVTIFFLVIQIVGELHIMQLFESLMEIVTPLLQLAISVLQLLIKVGADIIRKLIPIVVAILKVAIQVIKVLFKIVQWLLVTLFKLLFPLLKAVIAVVKFVVRVFLHKSASFSHRALLSIAENLQDRLDAEDETLDAANRFETFNLYTTAMRYYSVGQYDEFLAAMDEIHQGIRSQDHFHETGEPLPAGAGVPDYNRHLYEEADLAEHERTRRPQKMTPQPTAGPQKRTTTTQKRKPLSLDEIEDPVERARQALINELNAAMEKIQETSSPSTEMPEDFVESEASEAESDEELAILKHGAEWRSKKSREEYYASLGPDDWWRIDTSWNMSASEVFPLLKGEKLRRPPLDSLTKPTSPEVAHKRRMLATAYRHAVEQAYYSTYKRHIQHGRFSRYFAKGWKHATGHDTLEGWAKEKFGNNKYESVAHWMHSNIPDFTNKGIFKHMKDADPESKERLYFHDWVNKHYGPEGIPREYYAMWEAQERYMEEDELLKTGSCKPSRPLPEFVHFPGKPQDKEGAVKINPRRRSLLGFEPFSLPLEFLYEDDCFTTPRRNPLCIPQIPLSWKLPFLNLSAVVLIYDLNNNTLCEPTWESTDCFICWKGFINAIRELQFSIYILDLISVIFIFGLFVPRPTELLCMLGKRVPPLNPLIQWWLLFPCGVFPNAAAWACFFINFIYLLELIALFLLFYYVLDDLYVWFRELLFAFWQIYITAKLALRDRRDYLIDYDEMQLNTMYNAYLRMYRRQQAMSDQPLIGTEMGGADVEAGRPRPPSRISAAKLIALSNHDGRLVSNILETEGRNDRMRESISAQLGEFAESMGATYVKKNRGATAKRVVQKLWKRSMHDTWTRIAAPMVVPMHLTPSYIRALIREEDAKAVPGVLRKAMKNQSEW